MNTFLYFLKNLKSVPMATTWGLEELAEMKGHQDLYTKQSPQRLKKLREFSMIESAVSSNRIEGVAIDDKRLQKCPVYELYFSRKNPLLQVIFTIFRFFPASCQGLFAMLYY